MNCETPCNRKKNYPINFSPPNLKCNSCNLSEGYKDSLWYGKYLEVLNLFSRSFAFFWKKLYWVFLFFLFSYPSFFYNLFYTPILPEHTCLSSFSHQNCCSTFSSWIVSNHYVIFFQIFVCLVLHFERFPSFPLSLL